MSAFVTALDTETFSATEGTESLAWRPASAGIRLVSATVSDRDSLQRELADARAMIAEQQERISYLESLTMTDELTGLLNRRGFYSHFRRELASARRHGTAGGVLVMIDLDGFKAINDTHGHLAGDSYLRQVARMISGAVREEDVVARLGGDEFAVLLTNTDPAAGLARAAQFVELARGRDVAWNGCELPVRFSLGVQPYGADDHEDEVMRQADVKMYSNKGSRRRKSAPRRIRRPA